MMAVKQFAQRTERAGVVHEKKELHKERHEKVREDYILKEPHAVYHR